MSREDGVATLVVDVSRLALPWVGCSQLGEETREAFADLRCRLKATRDCQELLHTDGTLALCFDGADDAFEAACFIRQSIGITRGGTPHLQLRLLLGVHSPGDAGSRCALEAMDAARRLPAKGLFASRRFFDALSPSLRTQFRIAGTGGNDTFYGVVPGQLYEGLCFEQEGTAVAIPAARLTTPEVSNGLKLRWRERQCRLDPQSPPITLGRDGSATIQIKTDFVSRTHARVAFEQTNYVLHDQSTNGTYVRIDEDAETFLHSEKIVLRGHGVISLGRTIQHSAAHLIYFAAT
ncbi:MAG: FHA domain-containing protein [Chromatiaceae bacterium]